MVLEEAPRSPGAESCGGSRALSGVARSAGPQALSGVTRSAGPQALSGVTRSAGPQALSGVTQLGGSLVSSCRLARSGGSRVSPGRWLRLLLVVLGAVVCLTACRVDTVVDLRVDPSGTGLVTVTLIADAETVARVPELAADLRLQDVRDAGWTVEGPTLRGDGGVEVGAWKRFVSASQLPEVLAEIAGAGVLFSDVQLTQSGTFARQRYDFGVTVNPSPPLETFSDDALAAVLDGNHFGRPLGDLLASVESPREALGLTFSLTLPESDDTFDASMGSSDGQTLVGADGEFAFAPEMDGSTATWTFAYGDQPVTVSASTVVEDATAPLWMTASRAAAVAFGLSLLTVAVVWIVKVVRTPRGRGRWATRRRKKHAEQRQAKEIKEATRPRQRLLRLLVVDVHGVIVRPTHPLEGLLLPVILEANPDIDPELVRDRHRRLVLGRLTPAEFWSDLGLGPISHEIETRYLSSFKLVPGLHSFLDQISGKFLPVAAVGNQPREWGRRLQRMAQLEDSVSSWMVSGDVGAALPERPLFEATRRVMSVDLSDCLYLSSVPEHLDAAKNLGMSTAYFAVSPDDLIDTGHATISTFDDILKNHNPSSRS